MKKRLKEIAMGLVNAEMFRDTVDTMACELGCHYQYNGDCLSPKFVDREDLKNKQQEVEFRKQASEYLMGLVDGMSDSNFKKGGLNG